jgi:hypothetical protein
MGHIHHDVQRSEASTHRINKITCFRFCSLRRHQITVRRNAKEYYHVRKITATTENEVLKEGLFVALHLSSIQAVAVLCKLRRDIEFYAVLQQKERMKNRLDNSIFFLKIQTLKYFYFIILL